jgi:amidase
VSGSLDPCSASATRIAAAIRSRALSSREAVDACLDRIARVNPTLNAVVALRAEEARREADEADADVARGAALGPLHGVPITVKDSFDTEALVSTWGTPGRRDFVPARDATAVARLRAAGAIVLGKTNTPELTLGFETLNPVYGRTANPYDPARTSGGSSGGAAAIVAAGGVPLEIGSDTGGSIRLPAHFCGIAGIRPTPGRVSRAGHAIGPGSAIDALTSIGPLARRVEDLGPALRILSGPDGRDPLLAPVPLGDPAAVDVAPLRVVWFLDNGVAPPDDDVAAVVRESVRALAEAGARVAEHRPAGVARTEPLFMQVVTLLEGASGILRRLERAGTKPAESSLVAFTAMPPVPEDVRGRILDEWDALRAELLAASQDFDLVVSPVNAHAALPHGEVDAHMRGFSYTMTWNLAGWPGAVVRAGTSRDGLPLGVQLVAPPWREEVALAAAAAIERAFGGWRPPEGIA